MRRLIVFVAIVALVALPLEAQKKERERLENCGNVLQEILNIPDGIPHDLLDKAECVLVFPSVKKGALGIGASYGRGAIVCRSGPKFTGRWGTPALFALEALSIGFQIGGQGTDFVLLVMNTKGANSVLSSKVKLGTDASIAGGPKGRTAEAATDVVLKAEILSYSRNKGLFAGVSLDGSTMREDRDANKKLFGRELTAKEIVREGKAGVPAAGQKLVGLLNSKSPVNKSDPKSLQ